MIEHHTRFNPFTCGKKLSTDVPVSLDHFNTIPHAWLYLTWFLRQNIFKLNARGELNARSGTRAPRFFFWLLDRCRLLAMPYDCESYTSHGHLPIRVLPFANINPFPPVIFIDCF